MLQWKHTRRQGLEIQKDVVIHRRFLIIDGDVVCWLDLVCRDYGRMARALGHNSNASSRWNVGKNGKRFL